MRTKRRSKEVYDDEENSRKFQKENKVREREKEILCV